jgi:hypothetical protein
MLPQIGAGSVRNNGAKKGSLIVICSDVVTEVLALIQRMQEEEAQEV